VPQVLGRRSVVPINSERNGPMATI
jgi:hypothetical protein